MKIIDRNPKHTITLLILGITILMCAACYQPTKAPAPTTEVGSQTAVVEQTTITQTPTEPSIPMAATVNGEGIPQLLIDNEILRYQIAFPEADTQQALEVTLDNAIDTYLFAQTARNDGFVVSDDEISTRITNLVNSLGSKDLFDQWLTDNYYTEESFRAALILSIESEYQRNAIAAAVPMEIEQVELAQILVYDQASADQIQQALDNGSDFDWLAAQYHPITKGYLGWNARGTFLQPALEETAFTLGTGEFSTAIPTEYGYHFIKVITKEVRPLSVQNRQTLQHQALNQWIETQRQSSTIEVLTTNQ